MASSRINAELPPLHIRWLQQDVLSCSHNRPTNLFIRHAGSSRLQPSPAGTAGLFSLLRPAAPPAKYTSQSLLTSRARPLRSATPTPHVHLFIASQLASSSAFQKKTIRTILQPPAQPLPPSSYSCSLQYHFRSCTLHSAPTTHRYHPLTSSLVSHRLLPLRAPPRFHISR